ncbi:MAG: hypothetical protein HY873_03950 [Chloroflexi bacterium]|nr:hypothetical protein [Chloroflexota bacterium]
MTIEDRLHSPEVDAQLDREELARRKIARVKANKTFMDGLRASIEARLRGEKGTPFEELQWKKKDA